MEQSKKNIVWEVIKAIIYAVLGVLGGQALM